MKRLSNIVLALIINLCAFAQNREIPYTQEDKERLIRLEVKVDEGFKRIDERFESMEKRFDSMEKRFDSMEKSFDLQISEIKSLFLSLFLWGFGVLFGAIGLIFGYLLYERRTTISTLDNNDKLLEERVEKLERELNKVA